MWEHPLSYLSLSLSESGADLLVRSLLRHPTKETRRTEEDGRSAFGWMSAWKERWHVECMARGRLSLLQIYTYSSRRR